MDIFTFPHYCSGVSRERLKKYALHCYRCGGSAGLSPASLKHELLTLVSNFTQYKVAIYFIQCHLEQFPENFYEGTKIALQWRLF